MQVIDGAKTFLLEGSNRKAVLLIHGYTGTPSEMLPLGNYLNQLGYTVLCRRLPGHGTSVGDLERTTAEDLYSAAKDACVAFWGVMRTYMWQACRWADCWPSSWRRCCR